MVLGEDRQSNANLARALVAEGFDVATVHDRAELAAVNRAPHAVLLDERCALEHPGCVEQLFASAPGIAVLAHNCTNPAITDALLRAHGVGKMAALPSGATTREVISALNVLAPSASA
jgi:ActR/RegA family two-component response regulator